MNNLSPHNHHPRQFGEYTYVYPVISRRSDGLSLGINLSRHHRACSFRCVYCQVLAETEDAPVADSSRSVDLALFAEELRELLAQAVAGKIFASLPPEQRQLRDVAFSGDGEPTLVPEFEEACSIVVDVLREVTLPVNPVLITNATNLTSPAAMRGIEKLLQHSGEVWAKLDAGNEESFRRINRPQASAVTWQQVADSLIAFAAQHPVVIQTCIFNHGSTAGIDLQSYLSILQRLRLLKRVQLYTVARGVPEPDVTAVTPAELANIATALRNAVCIPVETFT